MTPQLLNHGQAIDRLLRRVMKDMKPDQPGVEKSTVHKSLFPKEKQPTREADRWHRLLRYPAPVAGATMRCAPTARAAHRALALAIEIRYRLIWIKGGSGGHGIVMHT